MECLICTDYTHNTNLCKKHCEDLLYMLKLEQGLTSSTFECHCHICGEFKDRRIIHYQGWAYICEQCILEESQKLGLNSPTIPTSKEILKKMTMVLTGSVTREAVADYVRPFVIDDNYRIEDPKLWKLMEAALGIDLMDSPKTYLHSEDDIRKWIEEFSDR